MDRDEALAQLLEEPYPVQMQDEDRIYVQKKFGLSASEFDEIMQLPAKTILNYPSYARIYEGRLYRGLRAVYLSLTNAFSKNK